jgi:geranylgeranyl diphosphate synthase, type II
LEDFKQICNDYRSRFDKRLYDFLAEQTALSHYSEDNVKYPYSLYDPLNYIMQGSGKRIRPLMLFFSCEAFGGNIEQALDAAVAIEILHNFTLVHDDIMDNADTRRGKTTIHKKWSVNEAILVGDELIGLSYRSLLRTKSKRIDEIIMEFTDGVIEVCEGQALDKEYETSDDVTYEDYIIMIRKKTAELLRISAVMGALIADAKKEEIETISNYSKNLGLAFQVQDDLLDVVGNEQEFGKKIGGDIIEKKKTYLYLRSIDLFDVPERERLKLLYSNGQPGQEKINEIIGMYKSSGVIESAKKEIRKFTDIANTYLSKIADGGAKGKLEKFSDMLLKRNY